MARNTNIEEILFPVMLKPVFLNGHKNPVPGFKAITGKNGGDGDPIFSIVSDGYKLITNKEALEMGKELHRKLFPSANADNFEIFNIIAPHTKSFCHIDIIEKNYTLNIWKQEVYVPFVRIHNSYNKSRSLQFDIGFCRKLCTNGVIFEQQTVTLKFAHTKHSLKSDWLENINVEHLRKLEKDFIDKTKVSLDIKLPREYFLPLAAKILNRNFNLKEKDPKKLDIIFDKLTVFAKSIEEYTDRYIAKENFGETAYAFFNVITDYASNTSQLQASAVSGLQTRCGMWINELGELVKRKDFSWGKEIEGYQDLIKK